MNDVQQRQILSAIAHGAIFFSSIIVAIGIPITILIISEDPVVKENAKESLNFHLNLYIYALLCIPLFFVLIGVPLFFMLIVASFIMPIIALINVVNNPNQPYHYPLIFRLV
jgi:uncharacterized protein